MSYEKKPTAMIVVNTEDISVDVAHPRYKATAMARIGDAEPYAMVVITSAYQGDAQRIAMDGIRAAL